MMWRGVRRRGRIDVEGGEEERGHWGIRVAHQQTTPQPLEERPLPPPLRQCQVIQRGLDGPAFLQAGRQRRLALKLLHVRGAGGRPGLRCRLAQSRHGAQVLQDLWRGV